MEVSENIPCHQNAESNATAEYMCFQISRPTSVLSQTVSTPWLRFQTESSGLLMNFPFIELPKYGHVQNAVLILRPKNIVVFITRTNNMLHIWVLMSKSRC